MPVTSQGTIVEIPPEEYRYVTQADRKPCYTMAGGHDAHCIARFEAVYAFWSRYAPPPPGYRFGHTARRIVANGLYPPRSSAPRMNAS